MREARSMLSTFKPDRLLAFSDGVISIAITLLVFGLEVPSVHDVTEKGLHEYLIATIHPFIGFVASFGLIGTYWLAHYAMFHYITHVSRMLVALNGLFLLCVAFVPFPTGLQAVYRDDEFAFVLYGATHTVCALSLVAMWVYASAGHRLIPASVSPQVIASMTKRISMVAIVAIAAIGVSFLNLSVARVMFLAVPIMFLSHRAIDTGLHPMMGGDDTPAV